MSPGNGTVHEHFDGSSQLPLILSTTIPHRTCLQMIPNGTHIGHVCWQYSSVSVVTRLYDYDLGYGILRPGAWRCAVLGWTESGCACCHASVWEEKLSLLCGSLYSQVQKTDYQIKSLQGNNSRNLIGNAANNVLITLFTTRTNSTAARNLSIHSYTSPSTKPPKTYTYTYIDRLFGAFRASTNNALLRCRLTD